MTFNVNTSSTQFIPRATYYIGGALISANVTSPSVITSAIELTGASLIQEIALLPGIANNTELYDAVVLAGQVAFAESYKYVYYTSVAFGGVSIVAACFLGDIKKYMDDHVAVVMH